MRRGLVGDRVGLHAAPHQLGQHLGGVAEQGDRDRLSLAAGALDHRQRFVEVLCLRVEIAGLEPHLDARRLALDRQQRRARHGGGERLRAAHAAEAGGEDPFAREAAAVVAPQQLGEGLVGALHDALRADIDPRARRHLAVHHQALAIELVEMVERRPVRHQVRVGDQHARRVGMGAKHADRLARLHAQRLVRLQGAQGRDDAVVSSPSRARRGRCRHRPRARAASRPPRGRGCSSACAAALRSASSWRESCVPRGARMTRALSRRVSIVDSRTLHARMRRAALGVFDRSRSLARPAHTLAIAP